MSTAETGTSEWMPRVVVFSFSTFSTESVGFLLDGAWSRWGRHLLFHVVGGLAAATAGVLLTRWILR